jgi:NADPH:quinone reductase-like Zn-dependent oxidoreductase
MKVFQIQDEFGLDSLKRAERPEPRPGRGQVVLKMKAASLNYRDLMTLKGVYNPKQPLPLVPLSDGVGEVVEVGEGVTRVKSGDRVCPIFAQKWFSGEPSPEVRSSTLGGPLDGTLAECGAFSEEGLVPVPDHLTDEEAATLPCAAVTAWDALVAKGSIKAGETVLVQGTGGVSIFALQFALLSGARVIVTSSSDAKLERAIHLGAACAINYRTTPDWASAVRDFAGSLGVDHVVEVGGAGTLAGAIQVAGLGGRVYVIGVLSGTAAQLDVRQVLMKGLRVQGVFVGPRDLFEAMNRAIALNRISPVVDRVFPFDEAPQAMKYLEGAGHFGKVVIRM